MENVRKHRNIKFVKTERRRNYFGSEPNYHTTTFFTENLLAVEIEIVYEFWFNYVKPKYGEKANLCYADTDNFILYIKEMMFLKILQKMLKADFW